METIKENNSKKIGFIDTVVVSFYYLFIGLALAAAFGFFSRVYVFVILALLVVVLFFFRNLIFWPKKYWWIFLLVPLVTAGFGFFRGFFSGDSYAFWLPPARDIVMTGYFPNAIFIDKYAHLSPFLSLLFAITFAISNSFNEFLCLWIPFFFSSATVYLLYLWAQEKGVEKNFLIFIPLLFLTNIIVQNAGWNLLQESLVLFFGTAFFYYFEKYRREQKLFYLFILISSFILAALAKVSGLFLGVMIVYLFFKVKNKKQFIIYTFLFSLPLILWFFRNYLLFDNPVFPLLSNIFKGRYYEILKNSGEFLNPGSDYFQSLSARYFYALKWLLIAFPFIFLSLYGFIKNRRYEYFVFFWLFFATKEAFLFSVSSAIRYYYIFLGILLVYSLIGLQKLKSKLIIRGLLLLAIAGLLFIPITNSSGTFISSLENKVAFLGVLFVFLQNYWYLVIIVFLPIVYFAGRREEVKIFLIFLYLLHILWLEFIYNKSWLNTWTVILFALLFLIYFALRKNIWQFKKVIILIIFLVIFLDSWLMAGIYYWRQGGVQLPVSYIYENSAWTKEVLDRNTDPAERSDFYILTAAQFDYYSWFSDYQAVLLGDFDFNSLTNLQYNDRLSVQDIKALFIRSRIKYIVKNSSEFIAILDNPEDFFNKVSNSEVFKLVAEKDNHYFIWQVY